MTLTVFRRIADPERVAGAVADVDGWLYRLARFAIREAAARTLDQVPSAKSALDQELRAYVRERLGETGIAVTERGVKDVILPGEIRSLLNTAKPMEDNPLPPRMKELEGLERLVEKVGRIDRRAGEGPGLDALLDKLIRLKPPEAA